MNALLDKAMHRIAALPEGEQDAIVSLILEELEAERGWEARLANTQHALGEIVRRSRAEVAEEDALPYDPGDRPGL